MIEWWGPIIHEYYGATEGLGFTACDSEQWLAHKGSVGKVMIGDLHILDENMQPAPKGTPGEIWFKTATPFEYFNDPERTQQTRSADGTMSTVGDVGYVDDDGFLYLTDRSTFMIISGGVNIYPQECENLLITHPKVADAAVFGVPNEEMGEEVKAVVQPMPGVDRRARAGGRADRLLPAAPGQAEVPDAASTSWTSCRACPPASCTRSRCATSTGRGTSRASSERRVLDRAAPAHARYSDARTCRAMITRWLMRLPSSSRRSVTEEMRRHPSRRDVPCARDAAPGCSSSISRARRGPRQP